MKVVGLEEFKKLTRKPRFAIKLYLDKKYWIPDMLELLDLIAEWKKKRVEYVKDRFDCEDFARAFKCFMTENGINSVGYVIDWLSRHSYNLVVSDEVYIFEPQTSELVMLSKRKIKYYSLFMPLILY